MDRCFFWAWNGIPGRDGGGGGGGGGSGSGDDLPRFLLLLLRSTKLRLNKNYVRVDHPPLLCPV